MQINKNIILNVFVNIALFYFVLFVLTPTYHSFDDGFFMYELAGGFGNAPNHLLVLNYILHPCFGWLIQNAFLHFPNFNWFTISLISIHLLSCLCIFNVLLKKYNKAIATIYYFVFFLLIESNLLLNLSFSVTAGIADMAGLLLLLYGIGNNYKSIKFILPIILIFIGSLIRVHVFLPIVAISIPFIICYDASVILKKIIPVFVILFIGIFFINLMQVNYYKKNINNWENSNKYSEAVYKQFNKPHLYYYSNNDSTNAISYLKNCYFFDKVFLNLNLLKNIDNIQFYLTKNDKQNWLNVLIELYKANKNIFCILIPI